MKQLSAGYNIPFGRMLSVCSGHKLFHLGNATTFLPRAPSMEVPRRDGIHHYIDHVNRQERRLQGPESSSPPASLDRLKGKTLVWYNAIHDAVDVSDLRDMVWSIKLGCQDVSDDDAFVHEHSLAFLGIHQSDELPNPPYALRRITALVLKKRVFTTSTMLEDYFLRFEPGHVISHPFANTFVVGSNLSFMTIIDKSLANTTHEERSEAARLVQHRASQVDAATLRLAIREATVWTAFRSDPVNLPSGD